MNQEKIGKFIQMRRKDKKITQEKLAENLGVSINAVSKWERGICLMDMSLLAPLSKILDVSIVDILSGEIVEEKKLNEKYEQSIENVIKLNKEKSKSFGVYGLLIAYVIICLYKVLNDLPTSDITSLLLGFVSFKFMYKYHLDKEKGDIIISIISFVCCVFMIVMYVSATCIK